MPYTFGAVHSFLTGTGSFAVASPTGLLLTLTTIPASADLEYGSPPRYRGLGDITLRDAMGWLPSVDLVVSPQLEVQLAVVPTQLAYNLRAGVVLEVRELLGGNVPNNQLQPWDRSLEMWNLTSNVERSAPIGETVMATYTVPASKRLALATATVWHSVQATTGVGARSICEVQISGTRVLHLQSFAYVSGEYRTIAMNGGTLYVNAGVVVRIVYQTTLSAGSGVIGAALAGYLFDA